MKEKIIDEKWFNEFTNLEDSNIIRNSVIRCNCRLQLSDMGYLECELKEGHSGDHHFSHNGESCGHSQRHEWFIFDEAQELEITVMTFKPSGKYYDTTVIKLSNIMNKVEEYEICWYLIVEQIRRFRNRCGTDLEYLIGYSDDSVKNYAKNDLYPILLKD